MSIKGDFIPRTPPATCPNCGVHGRPDLEVCLPGMPVICHGCGHAALVSEYGIRDFSKAELERPENQQKFAELRKIQEQFCMEKGWWG
jgi:hypothetical protein